jgi:hypothetical protein
MPARRNARRASSCRAVFILSAHLWQADEHDMLRNRPLADAAPTAHVQQAGEHFRTVSEDLTCRMRSRLRSKTR